MESRWNRKQGRPGCGGHRQCTYATSLFLTFTVHDSLCSLTRQSCPSTSQANNLRPTMPPVILAVLLLLLIQPWVNILVNTNSPIVYWNGKYATSELNLLKNNYHLNLLLLLNLPAWQPFFTDIAMSTVNQDEMGLSIVAPAQIDVQYGQTCASLCLNHIAGLIQTACVLFLRQPS